MPYFFYQKKKLFTIFLALLLIVILVANVSFDRYEKLDQSAVSESASMINSICQNKTEANPRWFLCYRDQFAALTKTHSLEYVLKVLSAIQKQNPKTTECHLIAHQIASSEVEKNLSHWKNLVGIVNGNYCDYGFMHGALEGRMRFDPNFKVNEQTIGEICKAVEEVNKLPNSYTLCAHAMGHILLAEQNGNIPTSIDMCRKTPKIAQFNCFAGVFMEDFTRFNLSVHNDAEPVPWNEETASRLEERCRKYDGTEANACWLEMAHLYVEFTPQNPEIVFQRCKVAPSKEDQDFCYSHAEGKLFVINRNKDNQFFISICQLYQDDMEKYKTCVSEGVGALVNNSLDLVSKTIDYCKSLSSDFSSSCYSTIGNFLQVLVTPNEQKKLCHEVPKNYQSDCLNRSNVANNLLSNPVSLWKEGVSVIIP